jgi:hypothetical protein
LILGFQERYPAEYPALRSVEERFMKSIFRIFSQPKLVGIVLLIWGGLFISCSLEPSSESPRGKVVDPVAGMPSAFTIYEPSVTFDGTTYTLSYDVTPPTPGSSVTYKAQKTVDTSVKKPDPQSIEALIVSYSGFLTPNPGTAFNAQSNYALVSKDLPYVIIPLDTSRIKDYLSQKYPQAEGDDSPFPHLVWIEENPAIGEIETETASWAAGTYKAAGIRISGLAGNDGTVVIPGTIDDFDDGEGGRILSIATVLADDYNQKKVRYTSTINFYAGDAAEAIRTGVGSDGALENAAAAETWIKAHKPVLRVEYRWAD